MTRDYVLPAVVAGVLHAGLFLAGHPVSAAGIAVHQIAISDPCPPVMEVSIEAEARDWQLEPGVSPNAVVQIERSPLLPSLDRFVVDTPRQEVPEANCGCVIGCPTDLGMELRIALSDEKLLESGDLDRQPHALSQAVPIYPYEARTSGAGGQVLVEFIVDEGGLVQNARATKSTDQKLNRAALQAVAQWRFEPGTRNGRAVRYRMAVPMVFRLEGE